MFLGFIFTVYFSMRSTVAIYRREGGLQDPSLYSKEYRSRKRNKIGK
jgi:hypothetical protein